MNCYRAEEEGARMQGARTHRQTPFCSLTDRWTTLVSINSRIYLFYFLISGMSASIECTDERKRDVNYARNDLKQQLQYRAQCVKERSYSTAPITYAINMHTIYAHQHLQRERERERERAREGWEEKKEREHQYSEDSYHTPIASILLHTNQNALRIDVRLDVHASAWSQPDKLTTLEEKRHKSSNRTTLKTQTGSTGTLSTPKCK